MHPRLSPSMLLAIVLLPFTIVVPVPLVVRRIVPDIEAFALTVCGPSGDKYTRGSHTPGNRTAHRAEPVCRVGKKEI